MTWPLLSLFLAAALSAMAQTVPPKHQILADDLKGGYQVITCDVNSDGKPDLIALASGMTDLLWFENPTWERHVMASNLPRMINAACWNRSPHEAPLVAVAYEFSMRPAESPGLVAQLKPNGDTRQPWKVTGFDKLPTSQPSTLGRYRRERKQSVGQCPAGCCRCASSELRRPRATLLLPH